MSRCSVRWRLPALLLGAEYLAISFLVDLPVDGPAMHLVDAIRIAVPVLIGTFAAGWIIARGDPVGRGESSPLPPWRPWPTLPAQFAAFFATVAVARTTLGEGAPPPSAAMMVALLACATAAALLALRTAAPFSWLRALLVRKWRLPLLALGLGLLAWRAAAAVESAWGTLSAGTLRAASWVLGASAFPITVVPEESLLGAGDFLVHVAPVCSGVDGLGLVLLFQGAWISIARERLRFPHALLLLPLGAALALVANVARLSTLIWVGAAGHRTLAADGLHSKLGWILFVAIALGTVAAAERVRWIRAERVGRPETASGIPATAPAYVAPLLAMLAVALVTRVFTGAGPDHWYGLRVAAGAGVLMAMRRSLPSVTIGSPWISLLLGIAVGTAWIALGEAAAPPGELAAPASDPGPAWIVVRVLGSCLVAPVVEELAFRGFLLRWLSTTDFEHAPPRVWTWNAVLLSSLAFGALHARWALGTLAGAGFAVAYLRRGRLADAVVAHAAANSVVALAVLLGGRWDLWHG